MGRDILHSTYLREKSLRDRELDCEVDGTTRAHFVQTLLRTEDVKGVTPSDRYNRAGVAFSIRLCRRHHYQQWKGAVIMKDEPINDSNKHTSPRVEGYSLGARELGRIRLVIR